MFKRIAIICELAAIIFAIFGLGLQGLNYDVAVALYGIAFAFGIYPVIRLAYDVGCSSLF